MRAARAETKATFTLNHPQALLCVEVRKKPSLRLRHALQRALVEVVHERSPEADRLPPLVRSEGGHNLEWPVW